MSLPSLEAECDLLAEAVEEAAKVAMAFVGNNPKVWTKSNDSPVSEGDLAVDRFLSERLRTARPDYGWLSEESPDDGSRLTAVRSFIVDPIDGTRSFITGGLDWTIPIAVVENGRPVAAALIAPRRSELFLAVAGGGATCNGTPIHVSARQDLDGATLAISRRFLHWDNPEEALRIHSIFFASLAYRLARVADGRLDGAAIKADAQDWDLAAADLLVHEAGGLLSDLDGRPPRYDRQVTAHPAMIASPPALSDAMLRLTRRALGAERD